MTCVPFVRRRRRFLDVCNESVGSPERLTLGTSGPAFRLMKRKQKRASARRVESPQPGNNWRPRPLTRSTLSLHTPATCAPFVSRVLFAFCEKKE